MSNEEKILSMLTKMQADIKAMQTDIELLKQGSNVKKQQLTPAEQLALLEMMSNSLTQEEKDELGRYQVSELGDFAFRFYDGGQGNRHLCTTSQRTDY